MPPTATPQSFEDIPPLYNTDKLVAYFHRKLDANKSVIDLANIPVDQVNFPEAFAKISYHSRLLSLPLVWIVPRELGGQFLAKLPSDCYLKQYDLTTAVNKCNRIELIRFTDQIDLRLRHTFD